MAFIVNAKTKTKDVAMTAKKKLKKKVTKKNVKVKSELVKMPILIAQLKKTKATKSAIAKRFGYKSHNTVTNWFKSQSVPKHLIAKLKTMAGA